MLFAKHELDLLKELILSFLAHLRELKKKSSGEAAETLTEMISQMNTTLKKIRGGEKTFDETDLDIFHFLLKEIRLKPALTADAIEFSDHIKDLRSKVNALQAKKNRLNSADWRKGLSPATQKQLEGYSERDRDREIERIHDRAYWFKLRSKTEKGRSHIHRRSKLLKTNGDNDE